MPINMTPDTSLPRIHVIGQVDDDTALWQLLASTESMSLRGEVDGAAGSYSLRTLTMRSVARTINSDGHELSYFDPTLFDTLLPEGADGDGFSLDILGRSATIKLVAGQRIGLTPLREQPGYQSPPKGTDPELRTAPFLIAAGTLSLADAHPLLGILPALDPDGRVDLDSDGIVYTARVVAPLGKGPGKGAAREIASRVRLTLAGGKLTLTLEPDKFTANATSDWYAEWQLLGDLTRLTRATAWARLHFDVADILPALAWQVELSDNQMQVAWAVTFLPRGVVTVTLADQPVESQWLAPEQVLTLIPDAVRFARDGNKLTVIVRAGADVDPELVYQYGASTPPVEHLSFTRPLAMVHAPAEVHRRLRQIYGSLVGEAEVLPGFLQLDDGWVELPFSRNPVLPKKMVSQPDNGVSAASAHGSLLVGTRRPELQLADASAREIPWSARIDVPAAFDATFVFDADHLDTATINLTGNAVQCRGMVWLACRAPDAHDALPPLDAESDAFFDLVLDRAADAAQPAPFVLHGGPGMRMLAPARPTSDDWDDRTVLRSLRAPSLGPDMGFAVDLAQLATEPPARGKVAAALPTARAWLHHPTLAVVQCMPATRSEPASPRPHGSRALTLFEQPLGPLKFLRATGMAPELDTAARQAFAAVDLDGTRPALAILSLPGIELTAHAPSDYRASGRHGLPVLDEVFARAALPLPPGAEPPPTSAPVTALNRVQLASLWREQQRRRVNAAVESDLMFAAGVPGTPLALARLSLAEPRAVNATATVDDTVAIGADNKITMGTVVFAQPKPAWRWSATGDTLLAGPTAALDMKANGKVVIVPAGAEPLVGWAIGERQAGGLTTDGRGVGWQQSPAALDEVLLRDVVIETEKGGETRRALASSRYALSVGGTGALSWRLAFTDLPMPEGGIGTWTPASVDQRMAGCEQGWTWSLYETAVWDALPLLLHGVFQFAPAALASITINDGKLVSEAVVDGALTLGGNSSGPANHAGCRVRLTFTRSTGANALTLSAVVPLDPNANGRLELDLCPESEGSVIRSGVSRLSTLPVLENGALRLKQPRLDITLFGCRTSIVLEDQTANTTIIKHKWKAPAGPLVLGLIAVNLDLAAACIVAIGLTGRLRDDVVVSVTEEVDANTVTHQAKAEVVWFGNRTVWLVDIDDMRRSLCLRAPQSGDLELFPFVPGGSVVTGTVCLTLDVPGAGAQFDIRTHFFEAIFLVSQELRVTHLMHTQDQGQPQDLLRFDGTLTRTNLVTWPDLADQPFDDLAAAGKARLEFSTADVVVHSAAFLLSDHRLPGTAVHKAASSGLALLEPGQQGEAPVAWLAEAVHTLSWHTGGVAGEATLVRRVQCLQRLQIWSGRQLATALAEQRTRYAFTASHGASATKNFPNPGVRMVEEGFAGLFRPDIITALAVLDESWLVLGNMTALCPGQDTTEMFQPLHLPFIGAPGEHDALDTVRKLLGVPPSTVNSLLTMSRHDLLGPALRIDASKAMPSGMLASLPVALTIPFGLAALPADTISGEALRCGWLRRSAAVETGLHVEQLQFSVDPLETAPLPHAFPRATVMLRFFRKWKADAGLPALSLLVRPAEGAAPHPAKVSMVHIQPGTTASAGTTYAAPPELIIGGAAGLRRQVVSGVTAGPEYATQLLAIAMEHMGDPGFIVLREAQLEAGVGTCTFTGIELAARVPDQLAFAARALRPGQIFGTDGHLTWPETRSEGSDRKARLQARWPARTPFQAPLLGVAGLRGRVAPARLAGEFFRFTSTPPATKPLLAAPGTVWLQEWEKTVFAAASVAPEDAPPSAYDIPAPAWPLAPNASAVAAAMGRMDPAAAQAGTAFMQTYLPPCIDDVDLPSRLGSMTGRGLRVLRTWDDGKGREDAPALAGLAQTRSMRSPRPVAIPANDGDCRTWGRTVGWYGQPDLSCLALQGAWDMLAAAPGPQGIPPWCILVGKPARIKLDPLAIQAGQGWGGSVRLACEVLLFDTTGQASRHPEPARFILDVLSHAGASVRAGLQSDAQLLPFHEVAQTGNHTLEFHLPPQAERPSSKVQYRFECGWLVESGPFASTATGDVSLPDYQAPRTLDPTAYRKLSLYLPAVSEELFRLPLIERTVFFSDPAFDVQLSRVQGVSDSVRLKDTTLHFWLDRPSAAPGETLVLRATAPDPGPDSLILSASIKRKQSSATTGAKLLFQFNPPAATIEIKNGVYLALPLSLLTDEAKTGIAAGDILRLELTPAADSDKTVVLFLPIRHQSALAAPPALYSLTAIDVVRQRARCASHSAAPQPDGLVTHVQEEGICRRALFKWHVTQPPAAGAMAYSLCKTDLTTESTHVPDSIEPEFEVTTTAGV